jgi:hypothetical protein
MSEAAAEVVQLALITSLASTWIVQRRAIGARILSEQDRPRARAVTAASGNVN